MPDYTNGQKLKAFEYIEKNDRKLAEDAINQIEKVQPHYKYLTTLLKVFQHFLSHQGLEEKQIQGVHIPTRFVYQRTLFIAVSLWLYSPSIYNRKTKYSIENGIRHELEGLLLCNEQWISQQVDKISFDYSSNYMEFKDTINNILNYVKANVKEKQVEVQETKPELTMFQ
jgi:hypothetical protein